MRIDITKHPEATAFVATNEDGQETAFTASPEAGGNGHGARPMEAVAMGLGTCSSIDVLAILEKQRQPPDRFDVQVDARRRDDVPRTFTALDVHYRLSGDLDPARLRRAIELSLGKYCSVAAMLQHTATITYSLTLNGTLVESEQPYA